MIFFNFLLYKLVLKRRVLKGFAYLCHFYTRSPLVKKPFLGREFNKNVKNTNGLTSFVFWPTGKKVTVLVFSRLLTLFCFYGDGTAVLQLVSRLEGLPFVTCFSLGRATLFIKKKKKTGASRERGPGTHAGFEGPTRAAPGSQRAAFRLQEPPTPRLVPSVPRMRPAPPAPPDDVTARAEPGSVAGAGAELRGVRGGRQPG